MINIYCDESCYLQKDLNSPLVLGALSCPSDKKSKVYEDVRNLKTKHKMSTYNETKWIKISNSRLDYYLDLVDYFFNSDYLTFRTIVGQNKSSLKNEKYNNSDYYTWYYKMHFYLLNTVISPSEEYSIFFDYKDTRGGTRLKKLKDVLCNNIYDYKSDVIHSISQIDSTDSELMQIADILIGAVSHYHRGLYGDNVSSSAKKAIIQRILSNKVSLNKISPRYEQKFNVFLWTPREDS